MAAPTDGTMTSSCLCRGVAFSAAGAPIVHAVCYCDDCQEGARRIEALPNAPPVLDPDGGTDFIVYRKDRVECTRGAALLTTHKLKPGSPTRRMVASCCNSAMLLGFDDARHWVSMYRTRFPGAVPPVQMRICTKFRAGRGEIPDDAPSYPRYAFPFLTKLIGARIAMLLGR